MKALVTTFCVTLMICCAADCPASQLNSRRRPRALPAFGEGKRREHQAVTASPPHLRDNDMVLLAGFVRTTGEVSKHGKGSKGYKVSRSFLSFSVAAFS